MMMFRLVCDKCGRVTVTPIIAEASIPVYRKETGEHVNLSLCPEHKAEFERFISDFIKGENNG